MSTAFPCSSLKILPYPRGSFPPDDSVATPFGSPRVEVEGIVSSSNLPYLLCSVPPDSLGFNVATNPSAS